jgi:serine/threonine protein phosphatase PrpC
MGLMQGRRIKQEDVVEAGILRVCGSEAPEACKFDAHPADACITTCKEVLFAAVFDGAPSGMTCACMLARKVLSLLSFAPFGAGHGGSRVSKMAGTRVRELLQTSALLHAGDYGGAIRKALSDFDDEVVEVARLASRRRETDGAGPVEPDTRTADAKRMERVQRREQRAGGGTKSASEPWQDGSTAVVIIIDGRTATVGNIGDSSVAALRVSNADGALRSAESTLAFYILFIGIGILLKEPWYSAKRALAFC